MGIGVFDSLNKFNRFGYVFAFESINPMSLLIRCLQSVFIYLNGGRVCDVLEKVCRSLKVWIRFECYVNGWVSSDKFMHERYRCVIG